MTNRLNKLSLGKSEGLRPSNPLPQLSESLLYSRRLQQRKEGGVKVCGIAVLRYFWCGFAEIFILNCGISVFHYAAVCGLCKC